MIRGTQVIVKSHEGKPEQRRVWEDEGSLRVLVVTEEGWQKREKLLPDLWIVSKKKVFKWDEAVYNQMAKAAGAELESLWNKAQPWEDLKSIKDTFEVEA
jgi:hypothetical protein